MKHILIAVIGSTPQVLTETFWALCVERGIPIGEIFVFTTAKGKETCQQRLFEEGRFARLLKDYGIPPDAVAFTPDHILVFEDAQGNPLEDIRTSEENQRAQDAIFRHIETWTQNDQIALHASLAGGRKSMGFLLGAAIQLFGRAQDRLYHVLVSRTEIERPDASFFYPLPPGKTEPVYVRSRQTEQDEPLLVQGKPLTTDDIAIALADVPICRLRPLVQFAAPGHYTDETLSLTEQAIEDYARRIQREYAEKAASGDADAFPEIIGRSAYILQLKEKIRLYAPYNRPVLITGPTGSGKELVAAALHRASNRTGRYVKVNCAELGDTAQSLLFGHEKGSFSGAINQHAGYFEQANGGTLFLDEFNSLQPDVQSMLLRATESGEIQRMGSQKPIAVNVRIITAANEDLLKKSATGAFREDLFERFPLTIATKAMKDHPDDIPFLSHYFLNRFSREERKRLAGFTPGAMAVLQQRDWPRNIRELKNAIDRAAILTPENGLISEKILSEDATPTSSQTILSDGTLEEQIARFEARLIRNALDQNAGNIERAAKALGMERSTLSRKIKKHGLK